MCHYTQDTHACIYTDCPPPPKKKKKKKKKNDDRTFASISFEILNWSEYE